MDAKQILGVSVLAIAGAVSAQTVPQEQWVVAPFPTTGSLDRASVTADASGVVRSAQAPQEFRIGPPDTRAGATDRAGVVADLRTWIGAGQGQFASGERYDAPRAPAYRARRMAVNLRGAPVLPAPQGLNTAAAVDARFEGGSQAQ